MKVSPQKRLIKHSLRCPRNKSGTHVRNPGTWNPTIHGPWTDYLESVDSAERRRTRHGRQSSPLRALHGTFCNAIECHLASAFETRRRIEGAREAAILATLLAARSAADQTNRRQRSWAFIRHLICHQRKRTTAVVYGKLRLISWLVARAFTGKFYKKGACCNRFYRAPT